MSKKLEAKRARREAEAQREAERRKAARRTNLITGGVSLVVLGIVAVAVFSARSNQAPGGVSDASKAPEGVVSKEIEDRQHVEGPVAYPDDPPMGGNHAGVWQNCGFYDTPIVKEQGVHSLEHGAVWIAYSPSLPQADKDRLEQLAQGEDFLLITPYDGLQSPIVASAWGKRLETSSADDPKLAQFAGFFQVGPQAPEPGAPCTGGVT